MNLILIKFGLIIFLKMASLKTLNEINFKTILFVN